MEEIKMYELEWSGRVDRSVSEVTEILGDAVKKCVDIGVGANDKWSVTSTPTWRDFYKNRYEKKRICDLYIGIDERKRRNKLEVERDQGIPPPF